MIAEQWFSFNVTGSAMLCVSKKLMLLKKHIREFSKLNYSGIELRTHETHVVMLTAQDATLANPTVANAEQELECTRKWSDLSKAEESFYLQRSSISWMALGDSNTPYYHRLVSTRRSANHIHYLLDEAGEKIDMQAAIENHCV